MDGYWENKFENFLLKNFSSVKFRLKIPLKLSWKEKKEKLFFQETLKNCRSTEDHLQVCLYYLSKNNPVKAKDFYQKARSAASFPLDYAQLGKHHFMVTGNLAVAEKYLAFSMKILIKAGRRPQELLHAIEGFYRDDLHKDKNADRVREWHFKTRDHLQGSFDKIHLTFQTQLFLVGSFRG